MTAVESWENLTVSGAFLLGVIFATIATLRVVRSVMVLFEGSRRRRTRRRHVPAPPDPDDDDD